MIKISYQREIKQNYFLNLEKINLGIVRKLAKISKEKKKIQLFKISILSRNLKFEYAWSSILKSKNILCEQIYKLLKSVIL